jgi:hypothetical protein
MKANLQPLNFDEFGTPESSWKEARSSAKKRHIVLIYSILVIDVIALTAALANPPYSGFDIFQIILESLIVAVLLPKVLFRQKKGIRNLSVEDGMLKIKSGIYYRKSIPLRELDRVRVSKKQNGKRRLILHLKQGKKEETRFFLNLPLKEDRRRMLEWLNEVNDLIQDQKSLPG